MKKKSEITEDQKQHACGEIIGESQETNLQSKENCGKPYYELDDTPFVAVLNKKDRWVIVFGKNMITAKEFETLEEAQNWAKAYDWCAILNVIGIYVDHINKGGNNNE